ncbi:MAG: hypothetical protein DRR04_12195 [Gammaproteobacteria bacterium]|nr:MAG: hypothetical protein DRR04_12195 [Gammaproteobacteria bacterium]
MSPEYKREKLRFQKRENRPVLNRNEFMYWMDFLPKVLKIGTEFEINLPDARQVLSEPDTEPCVHASKACAKDCSNLEECLTDRHPTFCMTRETSKFLGDSFTCPASNDGDTDACKSCDAYILNCRGDACASYAPACGTCPAFLRKGEVIEKANVRRDAETIRSEMRQILQPTEFVGQVGKSGALEVKKDDSLINNGGIEVPTVGRRVHWQSFYQMCKDIIDPIVERGGFVNERCGQHYHVLAGYLPGAMNPNRRGTQVSDLECPLPEIVLANMHQLFRRYELAMFWIMSSGATEGNLTRWAKFRQSLGRFSALSSRMPRVYNEMAEGIVSMRNSQKGKYASTTYQFCRFDDNGDVATFHIENRIADGCLSPAVSTAWAMLCYALVLKAVRLSQYGILETGSSDYKAITKEIFPNLIDGGTREWGDNRFADTRRLKPYYPWLQDNAKEMITLLKPELSSMGPAYDVLLGLAEAPCSLRLIKGDSWEKIEQDLYGEYANSTRVDGEFEEELREAVDLANVIECSHLDAWIEEVAAYLGKDPGQVDQVVRDMVDRGEYRWSEPIGGLITA